MALQGTAGTVAPVFEVADATPEDHDGILALTIAAFGASDEPGVRLRLDGPQADVARWTVVRHDGRVVSCSTLLPFSLRLDGLDLPAGQIEFVASDPACQRQGLIRRQFEVHHRRSAEAGHVIQLIGGIPYVYRRFGYGYGISHPDLFHVRAGELTPDPSVEITPLTGDDLAALGGGAIDRGRARTGLSTDHHAALARRLWMARWADAPNSGPERLFVARRGGAIAGLLALTLWASEQRALAVPSHTADRGVSDALVSHALDEAGDFEVVLQDTPGSDWSAHLQAVGTWWGPWLGLYCRIPDPVAFLQVVRPLLSARLAASPLASAAGEVTISLYNDAVRLAYAGGEVTDVARADPIEDPFEDGEAGVAPDWFPALVLGRWGAVGLEERIDDVTLGPHRQLLEILFPARPADVVDGF